MRTSQDGKSAEATTHEVATLRQENEALRELLARAEAIERELADSEARYRSLFEALAEGVVMQDAQGTILACNEAAERILGLSRDQIMGRTSLDPRWRSIKSDGTDYPGPEHVFRYKASGVGPGER